LGADIGPWNGIEAKQWLPIVEQWLDRTSKAPLKPHQKLKILSTFILPRLKFPLTISSPKLTILKKIDGLVRQFVKRWFKLLGSACDAALYTSRKQGGLGVDRLAKSIPSLWMSQSLKVLNSMDSVIRTAAEDWDLAAEVDRIGALAKVPRVERTAKKFHCDWRATEQEAWGNLKAQGQSVDTWCDPECSSWFLNPHVPDWHVVDYVRIRSNVWPC
jgi:hypothetical protein